MIEAPEALLLAGQLNEIVRGRLVTDVIARFTPHRFAWFSGDADEYAARLAGQTAGEARAYGGQIELPVGPWNLLFCDGVNLRWYAPGEKLPAKHQLLIAFDDQSCLVASVRMYGGLLCFAADGPDGPFAPYYLSAKTKPQVLSEAFTRDYFRSLYDAPESQNKTAKALLATGQTIPGLGNGVLQDILYRARIHPKTRIGSLDCNRRNDLYDCIRETLGDMYRLGGRDSETDLFGRAGGYRAHLSKDTAGTECPCCGETIRKESYLGGSIYYCPGCQGRSK